MTAYPWPSRRAAEQMPRVSEALTDAERAALVERVRREAADATRLPDWRYLVGVVVATVAASYLIGA